MKLAEKLTWRSTCLLAGGATPMSGVTVGELTRIPEFQGGEVLVGKSGLNRVASAGCLVDVPNATQPLRGGEFSVGSAAGKTGLLGEAIKGFSSAGAAGTAVARSGLEDELPRDPIGQADQLAFPRVGLPPHCTVIEFANAILSEIVRRQTVGLQHLLVAHKTIIGLASCSRGLDEVARFLSSYLRNPVCILSANLEPLALAPHDPLDVQLISQMMSLLTPSVADSPGESKRLLDCAISALRRDTATSCVVSQVTAKDSPVGFLVLPEVHHKSDELDRDLLDYAAIALSLALHKRAVRSGTLADAASTFLEDLVLGEAGDDNTLIAARARYLGWQISPEPEYRIVVISPKNVPPKSECMTAPSPSASQLLLELVQSELARLPGMPTGVIHGGSVAVVVPGSSRRDDLATLARNVVHRADRVSPGLSISAGMGRPYRLCELRRSYLEAHKALRFGPGESVSDGHCLFRYEDLGLIRLLSHVDPDELGRFWREELEAMIRYDCQNGTEYLHTLEVYLATDGSPMRSAEMLFVHPNTIKYRLRQLKDHFGIELEAFQERAILFAAIQAHRICAHG